MTPARLGIGTTGGWYVPCRTPGKSKSRLTSPAQPSAVLLLLASTGSMLPSSRTLHCCRRRIPIIFRLHPPPVAPAAPPAGARGGTSRPPRQRRPATPPGPPQRGAPAPQLGVERGWRDAPSARVHRPADDLPRRSLRPAPQRRQPGGAAGRRRPLPQRTASSSRETRSSR